MSKTVALVDACVLVPQQTADLLLSAAGQGAFDVKVTDLILAETERALIDDIGLTERAAWRKITAIRRAFPHATVSDYEPIIERLSIRDPDDRHVLAAAIKADALVIITQNEKDFVPTGENHPAAELIKILTPDEYLSAVYERDPDSVEHALVTMRKRMRNPPMTEAQILGGLFGKDFPNLVTLILQRRADEKSLNLLTTLTTPEPAKPATRGVSEVSDARRTLRLVDLPESTSHTPAKKPTA